MQWTQQEDELCYDEEGLDAIQKQNAAYNLGDLKREEDVLMTLYSKVSCLLSNTGYKNMVSSPLKRHRGSHVVAR